MKLAISGCLLGEKIRFDAGHKKDQFITEELSAYFEFISFCPEHLAFSTPRASLRLVEDENYIKVESNKTQEDLRSDLIQASRQELSKLQEQDLCGIIFKSRSPSCGMGSVKLYQPTGMSSGKGDGVFAQMCQDNYENLPMEEEGRLLDPWLRENFVMQLFAYKRFEEFKQEATHNTLVEFHKNHKFLLQSKDEKLYRHLGNVVANHSKHPFESVLLEYEKAFKEAIAEKSSVGKTRNVLEHMAGFLKKFLTKEEKKELHTLIDDFANRYIPVVVPLSTLKLYALKYEVEYLLEQVFLDPYPKELALRSAIKSVR
jgi:uncharacterized protein YbgA (DUF1722 family)/uncharacterized protein YbbK (DUF523 family)